MSLSGRLSVHVYIKKNVDFLRLRFPGIAKHQTALNE